MSVSGAVMWAELQTELTDSGLDAVVDAPSSRDHWRVTIDGLLAILSVVPRNPKDGYRDILIASLFGQDEESVIGGLTKFMGYSPFCRYQHRRIDQAFAAKGLTVTGTYEWDKDNPRKRLKELARDENVYGIKEIEAGLQTVSSETNMNDVYKEFTPEIVAQWETAVRKNPDAQYNFQKIADYLPFVRKVKPRIGKIQSLFGLSIISLDRTFKDETRVLAHGLEPLKEADIITEEEAGLIVEWFSNATPTWHSSTGGGTFQKTFDLDGHRYRLVTDCYRGHRDLNLQVVRER